MPDPLAFNTSDADSPVDVHHTSDTLPVHGDEPPIADAAVDTPYASSSAPDAVPFTPSDNDTAADSCVVTEAVAVAENNNDLSALARLLLPLSETLDEITRRLQRIELAAEIRTTRDATQKDIIDRLHAELQAHKEGLALKLLQPLAIDLISVVDDLGRILDRNLPGSESPHSAEKLVENVAALRDELEVILERYGFVASTSEHDIFDPHTQRVARRIATLDASLDRKIARRLGKSFSYEGRQIRPELVAVYRAETPSAPAASAPTS